jgi:hypothetical protein
MLNRLLDHHAGVAQERLAVAWVLAVECSPNLCLGLGHGFRVPHELRHHPPRPRRCLAPSGSGAQTHRRRRSGRRTSPCSRSGCARRRAGAATGKRTPWSRSSCTTPGMTPLRLRPTTRETTGRTSPPAPSRGHRRRPREQERRRISLTRDMVSLSPMGASYLTLRALRSSSVHSLRSALQ